MPGMTQAVHPGRNWKRRKGDLPPCPIRSPLLSPTPIGAHSQQLDRDRERDEDALLSSHSRHLPTHQHRSTNCRGIRSRGVLSSPIEILERPFQAYRLLPEPKPGLCASCIATPAYKLSAAEFSPSGESPLGRSAAKLPLTVKSCHRCRRLPCRLVPFFAWTTSPITYAPLVSRLKAAGAILLGIRHSRIPYGL